MKSTKRRWNDSGAGKMIKEENKETRRGGEGALRSREQSGGGEKKENFLWFLHS